MPAIKVNDAELYFQEHGSGEETIVFSHGLLMSSDMFRAQIEAFKGYYRCIAYDHRGQGRSQVTESGYDMDNVARDAAGLIENLDAAPCHFVGLSMGGFVGMRLAVHRPELLKSLVLMETSADPEPNVKAYRKLAFIGRWFGFGLVINRVMNIMFGQTFMSDPDRKQERTAWRDHILNGDRKGVTRAAHGVIDREGVYDLLGDIAIPTMVMVGDEDIATIPEKSMRIREKVPNACMVTIPRAGHSSSIEQPDAVSGAIQSFLQKRQRSSE